MDDISMWVKLLFTYGPFALIMLFVFFVERRAWAAMNAAPAKSKSVFVWVYSAVWLVIFGLVGFSVYAWSRVNLKKEFIVAGTFENLRGSETIASSAEPLFLRRVYGTGGRFNYEWRISTPERLPEGTPIPFTFDRSDCNRDYYTDHELVVHPSFYESKVRIIYDRNEDRLQASVDGVEEDLPVLSGLADAGDEDGEGKPVAAVSGGWRSGLGARLAGALAEIWSGTAYAQEAVPEPAYRERLVSSDALIRRQARQELADDPSAGSLIEKLLIGEKGDYRLALGALVALNSKEGIEVGPEARSAIVDLAAHSDPRMRQEARSFLVNRRTGALDEMVAEKLEAARGAGDEARVEALAGLRIELLYRLGVEQTDREPAAAQFRQAWALKDLLAPEERETFADPLFEAWAGEYETRFSSRVLAGQLAVAREIGQWFVVLESFPKTARLTADKRAELLRENGRQAKVVDTDLYPGLRSGLWAVVLGPFSGEKAEQVLAEVRAQVPTAYAKSGW